MASRPREVGLPVIPSFALGGASVNHMAYWGKSNPCVSGALPLDGLVSKGSNEAVH